MICWCHSDSVSVLLQVFYIAIVEKNFVSLKQKYGFPLNLSRYIYKIFPKLTNSLSKYVTIYLRYDNVARACAGLFLVKIYKDIHQSRISSAHLEASSGLRAEVFRLLSGGRQGSGHCLPWRGPDIQFPPPCCTVELRLS